jgi:mannose-6-phosphate isomerase-like protein (cupin superfamily)
MAALKDVRRVVTAHDATGKAIVLLDGPSPNQRANDASGVLSRVLWATDRTPAEMAGARDRADAAIGIPPPKGGSIFRTVDFAPMNEAVIAKLDKSLMAKGMGADHAGGKARPPRHPFMHRTRSVDYAIVLSGEIDMLLDDSEIHLKSGDVVVQQGTNHAWINRGKEVCRIAFVLIDAVDPLA